MKTISTLTILALLTVNLSAEEMSIKQEGVKYIKILGKELKTNLVAKMKEDSTGLKAAEFCANRAEEIKKEVNSKLPEGVSVRRTALKTRSEKNAPDATDLEVMTAYEAKAKEKKLDPKDIVVVEKDGVHRVYKPLLISNACLKCHGDAENISTEIKSVISKKYPKDMAMGFKKGDFRGVIVSEIKK